MTGKPQSQRRQNSDENDLDKCCHGNDSASNAGRIFFGIKLHLRQFNVVIIPERHSERIKVRRHLGICINSKVGSVSRVVLLPGDSADFWRAGSGEVCVHCHHNKAHVPVDCVKS